MGASGFLDEVRANRRRSALLLAATFGLLLVVANVVALLFGGYRQTSCPADASRFGTYAPGCTSTTVFRPVVLAVTVVVAGGYVLLSYLGSARAALSLSGARPADPRRHAQLVNIVEALAVGAGMSPPAVYVVDDPAPNAFATGRDPRHAVVVATTGLLGLMSRRELEGVMAHELSHVRNRDTSVMTLAVLSVGGIMVVCDLLLRIAWFGTWSGGGRRRGGQDNGGAVVVFGVSMLLYAIAVPVALLLRAALSRSREALADATAVDLTRYPTGLRSALEKLEADTTVVRRTSHATAHLWIESPLDRDQGQAGSFGRLFDTHPPLAQRIAQLRSYEGLDPAGRGPNDAVPTPRPEPAATGADPVGGPAPAWGPSSGAPGRNDDATQWGGRPRGRVRRGDWGGGGGPLGRGPGGLPGPFGLGGWGGGLGRRRIPPGFAGPWSRGPDAAGWPADPDGGPPPVVPPNDPGPRHDPVDDV